MTEARAITNRSRALRILVAAAILWFGASAFPFPASSKPFDSKATSDATVVSIATREGRLAVFDDAWSTINDRYYDRRFHGLDWNTQRTAFRSLAGESNSSAALYAVLRRMISALNDPHTRVYGPEEKFDWWRPRFITVGLSIREVEGLPTVVNVEAGSAPERAGIRAGDVIEKIDAKAALDLVQARLKAFPHHGTAYRMHAFSSLLEGRPATRVEIRWQNKAGKTKSATFERYWQQRELSLRVRREGKLAVVEMDAFTKPIAASFAKALKDKLKDVRGIVLDFRDNGGGDAEAMTDVASAFLSAGTNLGQFTDRFGMSYDLSTRTRSPFVSVPLERTHVPLVVLTSERTSSAAEILVEALKLNGRATVLGSESCGCVLAIRHRHTLPDGGLLDVSEMDYQTATGNRLEKRGVQPDQIMKLQRADLYSRRDRALQYSLQNLSATITAASRH
jgi:carboxyl-terminal processing protease